MNIKSEFKIGDVVTFRAYADQNIKAVIREVFPPSSGRNIFSWDLFAYRVEGISEPLNSITSGRSLVESKFFKCPVAHPFNWS